MKHFIILTAILCLLAVPCAGGIFAGETAGAAKRTSKAVEKRETIDTTADREKPLPAKKEAEDEFSDYPKTFTIPKGVCETNEPAMVIEK